MPKEMNLKRETYESQVKKKASGVEKECRCLPKWKTERQGKLEQLRHELVTRARAVQG